VPDCELADKCPRSLEDFVLKASFNQ